jgi:DNA polymerase-3 subunit gamma/tau
MEKKSEGKILINSFEQLLDICTQKKEIKLKYELEKNVNLVSFIKNRIEISFNDNLDKNFVKDLSLKLFEWTEQRWIITFSKNKGEISVKEKKENKKIEILNQAKDTELFKKVLEKFSDANLINVTEKDDQEK